MTAFAVVGWAHLVVWVSNEAGKDDWFVAASCEFLVPPKVVGCMDLDLDFAFVQWGGS